MNKVLEKLILVLLETGSIHTDTADKLLTELGSNYPSYTPDMRNVYASIKESAVTAETLNSDLGISESTLSRMVKSGFLVKNADNKYRVA